MESATDEGMWRSQAARELVFEDERVGLARNYGAEKVCGLIHGWVRQLGATRKENCCAEEEEGMEEEDDDT